jgi:hypothetical protein
LPAHWGHAGKTLEDAGRSMSVVDRAWYKIVQRIETCVGLMLRADAANKALETDSAFKSVDMQEIKTFQ